VRGIAIKAKCVWIQNGKQHSNERVTRSGIKRADAALAQTTFGLPSFRMYSALMIKS